MSIIETQHCLYREMADEVATEGSPATPLIARMAVLKKSRSTDDANRSPGHPSPQPAQRRQWKLKPALAPQIPSDPSDPSESVKEPDQKHEGKADDASY